ncbi:MAG: hypothetical protein ACP5QT_02725 [Brevinematia bacterium]
MRIANGVDPGIEFQTIVQSKERLKEEIRLQKEALKKEQLKQDTSQQKERKEFDTSRLALSDHSLKELLFLISSRGNISTVEKLAELLKKERALLMRLRK